MIQKIKYQKFKSWNIYHRICMICHRSIINCHNNQTIKYLKRLSYQTLHTFKKTKEYPHRKFLLWTKKRAIKDHNLKWQMLTSIHSKKSFKWRCKFNSNSKANSNNIITTKIHLKTILLNPNLNPKADLLPHPQTNIN